MGPGEVAWRARNTAMHHAWRRRAGDAWPTAHATPCWAGGGPLPAVPADIQVTPLVAAADAVLGGSWSALDTDASWRQADGPDWFRDPATGRRAPADEYCFTVPYRDEERIGNVKIVWELSRLHHVTMLAAAYHCTQRTEYADCAVAHLNSWWRANPPLRGVHWVSGIELGLRLIAFVWTRRLLHGYPRIDAAFETSVTFQRQLHAHQSWIATFRSRGSSANNHLIAEAVGLFVAAVCFPLFAESVPWAAAAREILEAEIERQTFPDGVHRELASSYHVFVLELLLIAAVEADRAGAPFSGGFWSRLREMADTLAASVDRQVRPARQGDGDDGRALLLDCPDSSAAEATLELSARVFGPAQWWPHLPGEGVAPALIGALARSHRCAGESDRPVRRPSWFPSAGIAILRNSPGCRELWCRLDVGPHGFLATAAHAHADALSFELRVAGQPVLVDPGTYCYHGEPAWRDYFRSTVGHNTLELDGLNQATQAGPFLWLTQPTTQVSEVAGLDNGHVASVEAWHDGYWRRGRARHHRRMTLRRRDRRFELRDWIDGDTPLDCRLAFHVHPEIVVESAGSEVRLCWDAGTVGLSLPAGLTWSAHRGETGPILGWYSPRFGCKVPTTVLLGVGRIGPGDVLTTEIDCAGQELARHAA